MGFIEILGLFVCFCLISAGIDLLKSYAQAKLMKRTISQGVDTLFTSVIKAGMKHRLAAKTVFSKEGGEDDEMPDLR
jgi:hypothetical protein